MSKAEHTQGPWEFTGFGATNKEAIVEHEDGLIEIYGANKEANARLIASAPKLLDAIESLLVDFESACYKLGIAHETEPAKKVRALIAEAKGE